MGEFLWYMRGDRDMQPLCYYSRKIATFSDDGETLHSAYGARMFGRHPLISVNQWQDALALLRRDPDTRQAVIHIRTPQDAAIPSRDHPCTLALQFLLRSGALHLVVTMRSNDIILGSCYDLFSFTLMQETMALELGVQLGQYYHQVGSWHLYETDLPVARATLANPGKPTPMPPMCGNRADLLAIAAEEQAIRSAVAEGRISTFEPSPVMNSYWRDWQSVLLRFAGADGRHDDFAACYHQVFDTYCQQRGTALPLRSVGNDHE